MEDPNYQSMQESSDYYSYSNSEMQIGEGNNNQEVGTEEHQSFWENQAGTSDMSISDTPTLETSDSDYAPTGRPYIPESVRRTTRHHGWFPGMYQE